MKARKGIIGLCLLCALVFSAFAVQSASAAEAGTTAFTCKETSEGVGERFNNAHCRDVLANGSTGTSPTGAFRHVEIPQNTQTKLTASNETTGGVTEEAKLETVQLGIPFAIDANKVSGTGTMENKVTAGGEHYVHGTGTIVYSELTVTPVTSSCKVKGSSITTKELTASSEGLAIGAGKQMHLKFKPATAGGTIFAEFGLEGCTPPELNGIYKLEGTLTTNEIDGATITTTEATVTAEGTFTLRKQKAGLSGTLTIKGEGTPLSATTVETP